MPVIVRPRRQLGKRVWSMSPGAIPRRLRCPPVAECVHGKYHANCGQGKRCAHIRPERSSFEKSRLIITKRVEREQAQASAIQILAVRSSSPFACASGAPAAEAPSDDCEILRSGVVRFFANTPAVGEESCDGLLQAPDRPHRCPAGVAEEFFLFVVGGVSSFSVQ